MVSTSRATPPTGTVAVEGEGDLVVVGFTTLLGQHRSILAPKYRPP